MSTERNPIEATEHSKEVSVTQFYGGPRGVCVQLTQSMSDGTFGYIQMDMEQAKEAIARLQSFVWENCNNVK